MSSSDMHCIHWNPFRLLVVLALWLIALVAGALLASGCGNPPPANSEPPPVNNNPPPASAAPASGALSLSWSLDDTNQRLIFCEQVNARSVALRLRNRATGDMVFTAVPCASSPATVSVPAASYDVVIELHGPDGTVLGTAPPGPPVTVVANRTTPLLPVVFVPNTLGTLVLQIQTPLESSCLATGANISTNEITVRRAGAQTGCAPTTFIIRAAFSGLELGQYAATDCVEPAETVCIESTRRLSTSLPAGPYVVHVLGRRGGARCWTGDAPVTIVAGRTLQATVSLVHQQNPGC